MITRRRKREEEKEQDSYQHEEHTPSNRVSILQLGAYAQMTQPHRNDHIGTYQTYKTTSMQEKKAKF